MKAFFRAENGDIIDLANVLLIIKDSNVYNVYLSHNLSTSISEEDYIRINNYLANWNHSVYFKRL